VRPARPPAVGENRAAGIRLSLKHALNVEN